MKRKLLIVGIVSVLVIAATWLVFRLLERRSRYEYSGTVETREIQIGSKVGGRVIAVPVEEGQVIRAGTSLVRFECDELKAQRAQAQASLEQAQADLDKMQRGNRPEEIDQAEATAKAQREAYEAAQHGPRRQEIDQAQAEFSAATSDANNAEVFYQRMEKLVATDTISRQQFDDAKNKSDAAAQRAESARQRLALLQAGTRVEDLNAAKARYQQAEAAATLSRKGFRKEDIDAARGRVAAAHGRVAELDARLREAELTAPADAVVEVVSVRPGDLVPSGSHRRSRCLRHRSYGSKSMCPRLTLRIFASARLRLCVWIASPVEPSRGMWVRSLRRRSSCPATFRPRAIVSTKSSA